MTEDNKHKLSLNDALGVLVSAAEARMQQWEGVGKGESPDSLIDELWDSAGSGNIEGQDMADMIGAALDMVREHRDEILDARPNPKYAFMSGRQMGKTYLTKLGAEVIRRGQEQADRLARQVAIILHDIDNGAIPDAPNAVRKLVQALAAQGYNDEGFAIAREHDSRSDHRADALSMVFGAPICGYFPNLEREIDDLVCPEGKQHESSPDPTDTRCIYCGKDMQR